MNRQQKTHALAVLVLAIASMHHGHTDQTKVGRAAIGKFSNTHFMEALSSINNTNIPDINTQYLTLRQL